ncbi:MAG: lysophospholipase [Candidatus Omnitrophica bacterium]|nr:lysophospholipase [Candidatus Omnitrophota bacterium]
MAIQEGFFEASDKERIFFRFQKGSQEKCLILLHGHGEHTGRYLKFFTRLEDTGVSLGTFDLRGCGLSGGRPVYVSSFEDYLADVSSFLSFLNKEFKIASPILLFGHSLGGLIATSWAEKNQDKVTKLILSSPLFKIPNEWGIKFVVPVLDRLAPRLVIKNPVHPPYLTHDPKEVEKYKADPLIQRRITVRLVREMLRHTTLFQEKETTVSFPVYILMAGTDFVVDPKGTRQFFDHLHAPEKKRESFPGFFHEIFNEKEQDKAFERLRYYLQRSVP